MWQVLVAAAVAGSTSLVAKHLLKNPKSVEEEKNEDYPFGEDPIGFVGAGFESKCDAKDGIFRFSSPGSGSKNWSTRSDCGKNLNLNKKKKRFGVCLKKKRKTIKNNDNNRGSGSSKESSLFSWGLEVGMMYMMSTGKSEINKLHTAMDETAKVVQELKTEVYKRKSSHMHQFSSSSDKDSASSNKIIRKYTTELGLGNSDSIRPVSDSCECGSSGLTEEPQPEVMEMDRLEAELESELQKLPWCITESSCQDENLTQIDQRNVAQSEFLVDGFHELKEKTSESFQLHGVLPSELDNKLCHVLIEQQENQIEELESELSLAQSKLQEKETELQALKDCVRRLTEVSLSNGSDDESEAKQEQVCTNEWDYNIKPGSELRKSMVGMKRRVNC
ncbi:hypothetical protein ACFE04_002261 [Oxalis oulophora]